MNVAVELGVPQEAQDFLTKSAYSRLLKKGCAPPAVRHAPMQRRVALVRLGGLIHEFGEGKVRKISSDAKREDGRISEEAFNFRCYRNYVSVSECLYLSVSMGNILSLEVASNSASQ